MPPKKASSVEVSSPQNAVSSSPPVPMKGVKTEKKLESDTDEPSKASSVRKMSTHPSTMEMVKEALKELDSRKGSSAQAIRGYILEKYPSVDAVRLKYMLRRALAKGLEGGTFVRPANSTGSGAQGRFRLAIRSKSKGPKLSGTENSDPNVEKPNVKKTKAKEAGSEMSKSTVKKKAEDPKPKASQEGPPSKVAPAKRPKKSAGDGGAKPSVKGAGSGAKVPKTKAPAGQPVEEGGAGKKPGKRGKKNAE